MNEHDMMDHEAGTPSNEHPTPADRWTRIVKSRFFAIGLVGVVLLAGFLLARRFGIGGRVLPGVGLVALMVVTHSLMHRGHGSQGGHGPHGGHGAHGGCGTSSRQRLESRPARTNNADSGSADKDEVDPQNSSRGHSGCH
jgi:hypothetical protein